MSNLTKYERFDNGGIEIVINTQTGESFASVSGYARMSNKDKSTISRRLQAVAKTDVKNAEIQTAGGLQAVALIPGKLASTWLAKDNPELLVAMSEVGWNVYCHKLAGYEVKSTAIELSRLQILEMALDSERKHLKTLAENQKLETQNKMLTGVCESLKEEIVEKEPLVQLAETLIIYDEDTVKVHEFAQAMNMSRNDMYDLLRDIKFIQQKPSRLPYQKHLDAKRVEVYRKPRSHQPGQYDTVPVLTAKGQKYVCKKIKELQNMKKIEVKMEAFLTADDF